MLLKFHKCTDRDYSLFYPPRRSDEKIFDVARRSMGLYCIDEDQPEIIIWG